MLFPGLRERLTWKTATKYIVSRNAFLNLNDGKGRIFVIDD